MTRDVLNRPQTTDERIVALIRAQVDYYIGKGKSHELMAAAYNQDLMLTYATDRWSAYEFVFSFPIPRKGIVSNISTALLKERLGWTAGVPSDLVSWGNSVMGQLKAPFRARLQKEGLLEEFLLRTSLVHRHEMIKDEFIIRRFCLGSFASAVEQGRLEFCGNVVEPGTRRGSRLSTLFRSPTNKATVGHDLERKWQDVEAENPGAHEFVEKVFTGLEGIVDGNKQGNLLDFKVEISRYAPVPSGYVLCDEISPDTVRLCRRKDVSKLIKTGTTLFFDKEFGRLEAARNGIKGLDPENREHIARASAWRGSPDFIRAMAAQYEAAFIMMTGSPSPEAAMAEHDSPLD